MLWGKGSTKGTRVKGEKNDEEKLSEEFVEERMDTHTDSKSDDESTLMKRFKKGNGEYLSVCTPYTSVCTC